MSVRAKVIEARSSIELEKEINDWLKSDSSISKIINLTHFEIASQSGFVVKTVTIFYTTYSAKDD